jgi:phosphoribosylformylglycinamidine synthase
MTGNHSGNLWQVDITVLPKAGVNDPEGDAIHGGLLQLGYREVQRVRSGRFFTLLLTAKSEAVARQRAEAMCEQLLTNPVIETYQITVLPALATSAQE